MSKNNLGSLAAPGPSTLDFDEADFDEAYYLEQYADVAEAIAAGHWKSGCEHYLRIGRSRGRLARFSPEVSRGKDVVLPAAVSAQPRSSIDPQMFDSDFYSKAYPLAEAEFQRTLVTTYERDGGHL